MSGFFNERLAKYTGITGMKGSEKLEKAVVFVCEVQFELWIAAQPKDPCTGKMRELVLAAGSQQSCCTAIVSLTRE